MGYCGGSSYGGCGNYTLDVSDGCASCDYDAPAAGVEYARFYSPSAHENLTDVKYDKVKADYDKETQAIIESVQGPPLEAYIPRSMGVPDGGSATAQPRDLVVREPRQEVAVARTIADEIMKAQKEILGKDFNVVGLREIEVEEEIRIRRKVRKREIVFRKNKSI